jgi:hypothetical protein
MANLIILALLVIVPVLLVMLLRANAAITFMGLCVGSVLVTYTTEDVTSIASGLSSHPGATITRWVQLLLLTLPFLLTCWFTRHSVKGSRQLFNLLPALAGGLLFTLLVVPLLAPSLQHALEHQTLWHELDSLQTAVVLGGAVLSLIFILSAHRSLRKAEAKHGKHA